MIRRAVLKRPASMHRGEGPCNLMAGMVGRERQGAMEGSGGFGAVSLPLTSFPAQLAVPHVGLDRGSEICVDEEILGCLHREVALEMSAAAADERTLVAHLTDATCTLQSHPRCQTGLAAPIRGRHQPQSARGQREEATEGRIVPVRQRQDPHAASR